MPLGECLNVNVQSLLSGFIDAVKSDDKRAAEKAQLKAEFEILLQCRSVDHLNKDIRCGEIRMFVDHFVRRNVWPVVSPQQIHQNDLIVLAQMMQGVNGRQVDKRDLIESDIDHAFLVCAANASQALVTYHRAGCRIEDGALADSIAADQRNTGTSVATQERTAKRDRRHCRGV